MKNFAKQPIHILLVEDLKVLREAIEESLNKNKNYIVQSCCTAKEALVQLRIQKYDLLITETNMPVMNGVQLVNEIHQITCLNILPSYSDNMGIIALCDNENYFTKENLSGSIKNNVDHVLQKPFSTQSLLKSINNVIKCIDKNKIKSAKFIPILDQISYNMGLTE